MFFNRNVTLRNIFLLAVSWFFYASWNWKLLFLIVFVSFVNYLCGNKIHDSKNDRKRKVWLHACLVLNLGVLFFFKYCDFFIESFVSLMGVFGLYLSPHPLKIILPVGISFYIFQGLGYSFDVYRRREEPDRDPIAFFAFIAFFPQLVAGPIERAKDLLPQFHGIRAFDYDNAREGFFDILAGLFKKMVIADRLAVYVDAVWKDPAHAAGLPSVIAVIFFTFQLYLDFSAYSQIACGVARLLGFSLHRNFDKPYLSVNFKDFWSRWHITLQTWFRDYVYFPLGGSRGSRARTWLNIMIVFALSGLWHGASWTFVVWGIVNGLFLIVFDKLLHLSPETALAKISSCFLVVGLWSLSLVFFRSGSFDTAMTMFGNLGFKEASHLFSYGLSEAEFGFAVVMLSFLVLLELILRKNEKELRACFFNRLTMLRWAVYIVLALGIIYLGIYGDGSDNAFIYFQF